MDPFELLDIEPVKPNGDLHDWETMLLEKYESVDNVDKGFIRDVAADCLRWSELDKIDRQQQKVCRIPICLRIFFVSRFYEPEGISCKVCRASFKSEEELQTHIQHFHSFAHSDECTWKGGYFRNSKNRHKQCIICGCSGDSAK